MQRFTMWVTFLVAMLFTAPTTAQTPAPPPTQSIAETHWTGRTSWEEGPSLEPEVWTLYFRSDGVLVNSSGASLESGHWRQRDGLVTFEINDYDVVHVGLLRGEAMEGVAYNSRGQQGTWTLRRQTSAVAELCPQNMVALRGGAAPLVCLCPQNIELATVWGDSAAYTDDSHICTAAVHAGLVTPQAGGVITVTPQPGRESYPASTANGVITLQYGPWQASYTVSTSRARKGR